MITPGDCLEYIFHSRSFSLFLGCVFLEFGIARWQKRNFSWKELGMTSLMAVGLKLILKV